MLNHLSFITYQRSVKHFRVLKERKQLDDITTTINVTLANVALAVTMSVALACAVRHYAACHSSNPVRNNENLAVPSRLLPSLPPTAVVAPVAVASPVADIPAPVPVHIPVLTKTALVTLILVVTIPVLRGTPR